jgi:PTH1 family peptidyl-tRNA hydrolase
VKLVVGLGNPGPEYAGTRHNVGFRVVERVAQRHGIPLARDRRLHGRFGTGTVAGVATGLLEPLTWMNLSGRAVQAAVDALPVGDVARDLLVVVDDLDLPFGRIRIRPGGGAGGHNGLTDVQDRLRRNDFARLRFGIGRPPAGADPVDYVLAAFDPEEAAALDGHLERAADAVEAVLTEGVAPAMNRFNAPPREEESA